MKPLPFLKLRERILYYATHYTWTFVAIMVLTLVSCAFSIHYLASLEADLKDVYENDVRGGDSIQAAALALVGLESRAKDLLLSETAADRDEARAAVRDLTGKLKRSVDAAASRFYTPKAKQAYLTSRDDLKAYLVILDDFVSRRSPDLRALNRVKGATADLQKDFDLLIANRFANSTKGISDLVFQLRLSLVFTVLFVLVTVVVRVVMYLAGHPKRRRKTDWPEG
jgi:hypothetical protein